MKQEKAVVDGQGSKKGRGSKKGALLHCAEVVALAAGELLKNSFLEGGASYEIKKDQSFVSSADLESHHLIVKRIKECFAHHSILSEEDEHSGGWESQDLTSFKEGDYLWVVDPLDGTSNFLHGIPYFNVTLGCLRFLSSSPLSFEVVVGVVYNPMTGELYSAERGGGVRKVVFGDEVELAALKDVSLSHAFVACGVRGEPWIEGLGAGYIELIRKVEGSRRLGSAALDLAKTAEGVFQVFCDGHVKIWDVAAGALFVQELGGQIYPFPSSSQHPLQNLQSSGLICGSAPATQQVYEHFQKYIS